MSKVETFSIEVRYPHPLTGNVLSTTPTDFTLPWSGRGKMASDMRHGFYTGTDIAIYRHSNIRRSIACRQKY